MLGTPPTVSSYSHSSWGGGSLVSLQDVLVNKYLNLSTRELSILTLKGVDISPYHLYVKTDLFLKKTKSMVEIIKMYDKWTAISSSRLESIKNILSKIENENKKIYVYETMLVVKVDDKVIPLDYLDNLTFLDGTIRIVFDEIGTFFNYGSVFSFKSLKFPNAVKKFSNYKIQNVAITFLSYKRDFFFERKVVKILRNNFKNTKLKEVKIDFSIKGVFYKNVNLTSQNIIVYNDEINVNNFIVKENILDKISLTELMKISHDKIESINTIEEYEKIQKRIKKIKT